MSNARKTEPSDTTQDNQESAKGTKSSLGISKKQIIIFAAAGLLVLGLLAGGSMVLMKSLTEEDPEAALRDKDESANATKESENGSSNEKAADGKQKPKSTVVYIAMQPAFITNFEGTAEQHFIQIEVTLVSHDASIEDDAKVHMPLLRNALVMLFGAQSFDDMQTTEGKDKLRKQALLDLQAILKKEIGKNGIDDVLFTSIAMQ